MLLTITLTITVLVVINLLLLKFSFNRNNKNSRTIKEPISLNSNLTVAATTGSANLAPTGS